MTIDFTDGSISSGTSGFLGHLDDNKNYVALTDGEEELFASTKLREE